MSALRKIDAQIIEFPSRPQIRLAFAGATPPTEPPSGGGPTWEPLHPGQLVAQRLLKEEEVDPKTSCWFYREMENFGIAKEKTDAYLHGKAYTTPQLARALGRTLPLSEMFFINLQTQYDRHMAPGVSTPLSSNPSPSDPK